MNKQVSFPFTQKVEESHIKKLAHSQVYLGVTGNYTKTWLQKLKTITFRRPVFCEPMSCFSIGPNFFHLGAHSYSKSCFPEVIKVGRYCAIGDSVSIIPANHPIDRLTTSGLDYAYYPFFPDGFRKEKPYHSPLELIIGNDVWIGQGAVLGRGIKIGDGAVIAMRSIVTKDVPPYAIVAGSPATVRKFRFPEKIIERLVKSEWFNYDPSSFKHLNTFAPEKFLNDFEELKSLGQLKPYNLEKVALHSIFCE